MFTILPKSLSIGETRNLGSEENTVVTAQLSDWKADPHSPEARSDCHVVALRPGKCGCGHDLVKVTVIQGLQVTRFDFGTCAVPSPLRVGRRRERGGQLLVKAGRELRPARPRIEQRWPFGATTTTTTGRSSPVEVILVGRQPEIRVVWALKAPMRRWPPKGDCRPEAFPGNHAARCPTQTSSASPIHPRGRVSRAGDERLAPL